MASLRHPNIVQVGHWAAILLAFSMCLLAGCSLQCCRSMPAAASASGNRWRHSQTCVVVAS